MVAERPALTFPQPGLAFAFKEITQDQDIMQYPSRFVYLGTLGIMQHVYLLSTHADLFVFQENINYIDLLKSQRP